MDKKELENLLMRFSHLGVTHSKNGALMIGKAPHIAEFAWLNVMYPCITEAEVCDLEKKLGCAIPEVYRNFLMNVSNGFDIILKSATTRLYDTEAKIICIVSKKGAQCIECHHKDI